MPSITLLKQNWLEPDWPVPANVKAVFSLRHSRMDDGKPAGVSTVPFDQLNLGSHVGDLPARVAANRQQLTQRIGCNLNNQPPVFLSQVHGNHAVQLDKNSPDGLKADAAFTTVPGIVCTVLVADCLPVLLASSCGRIVGAVHAGWRGLAGGVLEAEIAAFQACFSGFDQQTPAQAAIKMIAWLGPCIGPAMFEVGAEVRSAFVASRPEAAACFAPENEAGVQGKFHADLAGLARQRLQALGIQAIYGNDSSPAWCTVRHSALYFSHRRDAASVERGGNGCFTTGRMAACIWRVTGVAAGA